MRIAVLGPNWHPLVEPYAGGQEALVATLVTQLRARGHDVLLYAPTGTDPQLADELIPYPGLPELSAVAALDPQLPEPRFLADQHAFVGAMADLAGRATGRGAAHAVDADSVVDAVLNHSLHQLPLALSPLVPVPIVTTLHTPPFPWLELGADLAGPNARYVAVSRALAARWSTLVPAPTVIRNGVPLERFPRGPGGPDLVWVGRITAEKGTHVAIEAAAIAGRRLRIIGPIADVPYFEALVRPALGPRVEYLGHLDQRTLAGVVGHSAAALVTPRWDEPFGLVAVEAAACGTPVVALQRGGLGEVVAPGMGVLVTSREPGGNPPTGHTADQLDGDPTVAHAIAGAVPCAVALDREQVRATAVRLHCAERMAIDYERLLADLLQTDATPGPISTRASAPTAVPATAEPDFASQPFEAERVTR